MKVQKIIRNIMRQAQQISRESERRAKRIVTKACMNERARIKKQIAFKSAGTKGTRSQPGERPRTVGGKLNRMMQVTVFPTEGGDAKVTIQMRWKTPGAAALKRRLWAQLPPERQAEHRPEDRRKIDQQVSELLRMYGRRSPAIALDEGFGGTRARPFLKWIRDTVKINMEQAIENAAKQIGHWEKKKRKQ